MELLRKHVPAATIKHTRINGVVYAVHVEEL
jgi:hypothetical protein